jgi:uncharacterized membrane protein YdbT with pleckstrin-like domain
VAHPQPEPEPEKSRERTHEASPDGVSLLEGEFVLENETPSIVNWWKSITFAALLLLIAVSGDGITWGVVVLAVLIGGYAYLAQQKSQYVVTNQRVLKKVGLLRSSTGETRISDIRSLETDQGLIEGLVGKGSVRIDSAGAGGLLGIEGIDDHLSVANTIREQQRQTDVSQ